MMNMLKLKVYNIVLLNKSCSYSYFIYYIFIFYLLLYFCMIILSKHHFFKAEETVSNFLTIFCGHKIHSY